jgi:hypothetical protein
MPMSPTRCATVSPAAAAVPVPGALAAGERGAGPALGARIAKHLNPAHRRKRAAGGDR